MKGESQILKGEEFFCSGVSSKTGERKHVVFMDLDGKNLGETIKLSARIMHKYCLSETYIIRSSFGNYHMICLDKFSFDDVYNILRKYAHGNWVKYRAKSKDFVLRLSVKGLKPEPQLVCKVESPYNIRKKSNAHRILLNKKYGARIRKDKYFDNSSKIKIHFYRTRMVRK